MFLLIKVKSYKTIISLLRTVKILLNIHILLAVVAVAVAVAAAEFIFKNI